MGNFQVLFSGELSADGADPSAVQANLARELGINDAKARALFSGRTVVLRSQLDREQAVAIQEKLSELGALCRIKDFTPKQAQFKGDTNASDYTLRDITAAHLECPRCGHMQLDSSHCARCGVDLSLASKQQRKEDLIIEKKIRALRETQSGPTTEPEGAVDAQAPQSAAARPAAESRPRLTRVVSWFKGKR